MGSPQSPLFAEEESLNDEYTQADREFEEEALLLATLPPPKRARLQERLVAPLDSLDPSSASHVVSERPRILVTPRPPRNARELFEAASREDPHFPYASNNGNYFYYRCIQHNRLHYWKSSE